LEGLLVPLERKIQRPWKFRGKPFPTKGMPWGPFNKLGRMLRIGLNGFPGKKVRSFPNLKKFLKKKSLFLRMEQ